MIETLWEWHLICWRVEVWIVGISIGPLIGWFFPTWEFDKTPIYVGPRPPPPQGSGGTIPPDPTIPPRVVPNLSPPPPPSPAHYRTSDEYHKAIERYRETFKEFITTEGGAAIHNEWEVRYGKPRIVQRPTNPK